MADYNEGDIVTIKDPEGSFILTATLGPDGVLPRLPSDNLEWWETDLLFEVEVAHKAPPREPEGRHTLVKFNGFLPAIRTGDGLWEFVGGSYSHPGKTWEELVAYVGGPEAEFEVLEWTHH